MKLKLRFPRFVRIALLFVLGFFISISSLILTPPPASALTTAQVIASDLAGCAQVQSIGIRQIAGFAEQTIGSVVTTHVKWVLASEKGGCFYTTSASKPSGFSEMNKNRGRYGDAREWLKTKFPGEMNSAWRDFGGVVRTDTGYITWAGVGYRAPRPR